MKIEFGRLVLEWVSTNLWEVYEAFAVKVDGRPVYVPKGFRTDLASIPKVLWPILSPMGPWTPAAVLHDYMYAVQFCSKEQADEIFLRGMELLGVNEEERNTIYGAVRDFGHSAWKGHTLHNTVGMLTEGGLA